MAYCLFCCRTRAARAEHVYPFCCIHFNCFLCLFLPPFLSFLGLLMWHRKKESGSWAGRQRRTDRGGKYPGRVPLFFCIRCPRPRSLSFFNPRSFGSERTPTKNKDKDKGQNCISFRTFLLTSTYLLNQARHAHREAGRAARLGGQTGLGSCTSAADPDEGLK